MLWPVLYNNAPVVLDTLLQFGANPTQRHCTSKAAPLLFALRNGQWACARALLRAMRRRTCTSSAKADYDSGMQPSRLG